MTREKYNACAPIGARKTWAESTRQIEILPRHAVVAFQVTTMDHHIILCNADRVICVIKLGQYSPLNCPVQNPIARLDTQ